jgi:hypothetical protein
MKEVDWIGSCVVPCLFVRMVWRIRVQESIGPLIPSPTALRYLCAVLIRALIGFGADYRGTRDCTTSKDLAFSLCERQATYSRARVD